MIILKHGVLSCYTRHGCRCARCVEAYRQFYHVEGNGRKYTRKKLGVEEITEEQCIALLKHQGGQCAICKKLLSWPDRNTCVDHDHKTGKIRGILCTNCNRALGYFKDDSTVIKRAVGYLDSEVNYQTKLAKQKARGKRPNKDEGTFDY